MLPSVRPLMQRWSCGPVWEFADRNQIINACCRHKEYIWFSGPVSPTVALFGAWLEVGDERFNSNEIQRLYQADDYSLRKTE
jgi:hypothetical protein